MNNGPSQVHCIKPERKSSLVYLEDLTKSSCFIGLVKKVGEKG